MDKNYLNKILNKAQEIGASDIHLLSGLVPYVRTVGDIIPMDDFVPMTGKDIIDIFFSFMDKYSQENFLKYFQSDFSYFNVENKTRYRINIFRNNNGVSAALRQLNTNIPDLENSNYPDIIRKIASLNKGLVLVCGPTGSGKSTTLSAIIEYINKNQKKHIITIEDPIEYVFKSKNSIIDQREIGKSVLSFADGLKGCLREDPDVIMIGEMRDKDTIKMALTAAETGHLVFGTLHTMSASKSIDRIIDSVDLNEKEVVRSMISTSLQAVVLQTLLKANDPTKRIAAFEVLVGTGGIRNMIRENKTHQIDSMIQTGSKYGMVTMKEYIEKLLEKNLVDRADALSRIIKVDD